MRYSQADIEDLKRLYPRASWNEIEQRFPGKTRRAIHTLASKHHISREPVAILGQKEERRNNTRYVPPATANMKRFYRLLVVAESKARETGKSYSKLRLIERAMNLVREGSFHG